MKKVIGFLVIAAFFGVFGLADLSQAGACGTDQVEAAECEPRRDPSN